ncbi:MAG: hypothetical protein B7Z20_08730, partial [Sphingobium sp. 32-64-5]
MPRYWTFSLAALLASVAQPSHAAPVQPAPPGAGKAIAFDVHEGTSMSVSASPDGSSLAVDLQGSLWII